MDRFAAADALEEIALHLEFRKDNPFKARAYRKGARVLRDLDTDLDALVRTGGLGRLPGIGVALAEKITALVTTGRLPLLEELRESIPTSVLAWTRIPGLGPAKAMALHAALGVHTIEELEAACREGRVRAVGGMGPGMEARLLEGIAGLRQRGGRFLMPPVHAEAARLLEHLRGIPGVLRAEPAGELRRMSEVLEGADLVVAAASPEAAFDALAAWPATRAVVEHGPAECRVRLATGPPVRLRAVPPDAFACAWLALTGGDAHLAALRARARASGLDLGHDGLRDDRGVSLPCPDEQAVYAALGLPWIAPELREGLGEIEAAAEGRLPRLLERADLRGLLHVHSDWSDGRASIEEMAEGARAMGLDYLGLCDHSKSAGYAGGLSEARVRQQHAAVDALNRRWRGSFRVLKGIEVDVLPDGSLDYDDSVLATFELVVASVHGRFGLTEAEQTARLLRAIDNPYVDVLGHPTGRLLLAREPYPLDLPRVLAAATERGVAVEVNAHPNRLDLDWRALRPALAGGMRTSIDPDAHTVAELEGVRWGIAVARKGWCTAEDALDAWPLPHLLDHLARRRRAAGVGDAPTHREDE